MEEETGFLGAGRGIALNITIIHGQSHSGSTCHVARLLANKLRGDVKEFFLPKDFGEFCIGCTACFAQDETKCPHYEKLSPSQGRWMRQM